MRHTAKEDILEIVSRRNSREVPTAEDKKAMREEIERQVNEFLSNGGQVRAVTGSAYDLTCVRNAAGNTRFKHWDTVDLLKADLRKDSYYRGRAALKRKREAEKARRASAASQGEVSEGGEVGGLDIEDGESFQPGTIQPEGGV